MVVILFFDINFYEDSTVHENKYLNTSQIIPTLNPFQNSFRSLCVPFLIAFIPFQNKYPKFIPSL